MGCTEAVSFMPPYVPTVIRHLPTAKKAALSTHLGYAADGDSAAAKR